MKTLHLSILFIFVCILSMLIMSSAYAQNDSTFKYDPTLQYGSKPKTPAETPEQLHKKLVNARDAIANIMGSKMGNMPFYEVEIDEINSTLDVGIDSAKATLSEEQYLQKIKAIVGDIPIKITFGQSPTSLPLILTNNSVHGNVISAPILSPLKQFKSGVAANNIICRPDMQLLIQNQENFPICVKLDTVLNLLHRDWSYPTNCKYVSDPFTAGVESLIMIEKNASDPSSGKSYSPSNSTVVIGWNNTVSWINQDVYPSSVTSDWNLFDSGAILTGNDWKHNFDCAGNYGYHSEPHPWMKGWIRVLPPSR